MEDAAKHHSAKYGAKARRFGNWDHDWNESKTRPLHHRQSCTHWPKADGLHQCGDACKNHGHLYQVNHVTATERQTCGDRHQDGGGHVASEHGQYVLDAQRHRLG